MLAAIAAVCALGGATGSVGAARDAGRAEVVVVLHRPSLAAAMGLRARRSPAYLKKLDAGQAKLAELIAERFPTAKRIPAPPRLCVSPLSAFSRI